MLLGRKDCFDETFFGHSQTGECSVKKKTRWQVNCFRLFIRTSLLLASGTLSKSMASACRVALVFNSATVIERPSRVLPVVTLPPPHREGLPFCQFLCLVNSFRVFRLYFSEFYVDTKAADSVFLRNSIKLQFPRSVLFTDGGFFNSDLLLPVCFPRLFVSVLKQLTG